MNTRTPRRRRGMAMLLVMICMATATILASAYLASRENSPAIAENVQNTAAARWSSLSGLEMTVAMLETEFDWRTHAANDGMLLSDHPMGGHGTCGFSSLLLYSQPHASAQ